MNTFVALSLVFCSASAQLAAWPATSYSPYYQAVLGAARTPVLSYPTNVVAESAIPYAGAAPVVAAAPAYATAPVAPVAPVAPAYAPVAAPAYAAPVAPALTVAAAPVLRAPAFNYAPSPVLAPVAPAVAAAPAVVAAAPAVVAAAPAVVPRVVPAYAPFATSAMFIGSNKGANKSA